MKHKILFITFILFILFILSIISAYGNSCTNCDSQNNINLTLDGSAIQDASNILLTLEGGAVADSCSCPGLNQDWVVDMSDNCSLTVCELGTGTLNFTNTTSVGKVDCNGNINTTNLGVPPNTFILYINSTCNIQVR